jgi:hypothetical protein
MIKSPDRMITSALMIDLCDTYLVLLAVESPIRSLGPVI